MANKLPYPNFTNLITADIIIFDTGLNEQGAPFVLLEKECKGWFFEKTETILDRDGKFVRRVGSYISKGDIAPNIKDLSNGRLVINSIEYQIINVTRSRDLSGEVHHTRFEVN